MQKTRKISWQAIAIVVLALVLIASIALGVSGAWFQDNDSETATAKMGEAVTVKLANAADGKDPVTWNTMYTVDEAFPGDTVIGSTKVLVGSDSPMVLRYKVSAKIYDGDGRTAGDEVTETYIDNATEAMMPAYYEDGYADKATALVEWKKDAKASLTALTTELSAGIVSAAGWDKDASAAGYYYYEAVVESTNAIALFDTGITIPVAVNNGAAQWQIEITLEIDAIQAANLSQNGEWYGDLTETIKGQVDAHNAAGTGRVK